MIIYKSYESVNGVPFGATEEEIVETFGNPDSRRVWKERNNDISLYYSDYIIHLDKEGHFNAVDVIPFEQVIINGKSAGWTLKEVADIIKMDSHPVVDDADIKLYDLGVDFINFHDIEDDDTSERVIGLCAKGEMEHYDSEKPFRLIEDRDNPYNELEIIEEEDTHQETNSNYGDIIPDDFMK